LGLSGEIPADVFGAGDRDRQEAVMVNWTAIFFVTLVMAYFAALAFIENQHAKRAFISNDEFLDSLAKVRKCSVYDLFISSGGEWRFSNGKIETDFNSYLKTGHIPHYVISYVKQNIRPDDVKSLRRIGRLW
jgi:hypothetical protein